MKLIFLGIVLVAITAKPDMLMAQEIDDPTAEQYEPQVEVSYRSPVIAVLLPVGVTIGSFFGGALISGLGVPELGVAIAVTGTAIGPSTGHMYTGSWWRVLGFSLGRAGMIGLFITV